MEQELTADQVERSDRSAQLCRNTVQCAGQRRAALLHRDFAIAPGHGLRQRLQGGGQFLVTCAIGKPGR